MKTESEKSTEFAAPLWKYVTKKKQLLVVGMLLLDVTNVKFFLRGLIEG